MRLSLREIEYGCAISLEMSNVQMADLFGIRSSTARRAVCGLKQKVHLEERRGLGAYFEEAIARWATLICW